MINTAAVVTDGGLVLWTTSKNIFDPLPLNKLIQNVLIPQQSISSFKHSIYTLNWLRDNKLGLLFVIVYLKLSNLLPVEKLLQSFKSSFISSHEARIKQVVSNPQSLPKMPSFCFENDFDRIEKMFQTPQEPSKNRPERVIAAKHAAKAAKNIAQTEVKAESKRKKPQKEKRVWIGLNKKLSSKEKSALDFSSSLRNADSDALSEEYKIAAPDQSAQLSSSDENSGTDLETPESGTQSFGTKMSSILSNFSSKALTEENLQKPLEAVEQLLIDKNVGSEISRQVVKTVSEKLVGKKAGKLASVNNLVRETLRDSLLQIITPETPVRILKGIAKSREMKRPFSVVFIGVNGVGKSTTLSKIAFYLRKRNLQVSFAACDTFRSGAVEQLLTHAKALKMRVFHKGYNKDASQICSSALGEAQKMKDDVILIDTAGRMQNNEPLLRSLQRLVQNNKPDLVLFVGEALVGNEATNQLESFGKYVKIDGIVLTKMDAVDDKVGAAISMTYKTRLPVVFLGVGQTHSALAKVDNSKLVDILLR